MSNFVETAGVSSKAGNPKVKVGYRSVAGRARRPSAALDNLIRPELTASRGGDRAG